MSLKTSGYNLFRDQQCPKIVLLEKNDKYVRLIKTIYVEDTVKEFKIKGNKYIIPSECTYLNRYGIPVYLIDVNTGNPLTFYNDKDALLSPKLLDHLFKEKLIIGMGKAFLEKAKMESSIGLLWFCFGICMGIILGYVGLPAIIQKWG